MQFLACSLDMSAKKYFSRMTTFICRGVIGQKAPGTRSLALVQLPSEVEVLEHLLVLADSFPHRV